MKDEYTSAWMYEWNEWMNKLTSEWKYEWMKDCVNV